MASDSAKYNWLVLGGCGFIGRNLVAYLVNNGLANKIRVADKSLPATAHLAPAHKAVFEQKDIVEFKQCDLSRDDHVKRAFADFQPNFVVNLCGETRFGLSEAEYKQKCLEPALKCSVAARDAHVDRWIEVSTAQVYEPDKKASDEKSKLKPWTTQAKFRLDAEQAVLSCSGLDVVVLRPAIVYGSGDLTGLTPRIACAAVYQKNKEKMKFLWDGDLKINTVHVDDVARAILCCCVDVKKDKEVPSGTIFNLADKTDLTQGKFNTYLSNLFKIETGFLGSMISNLAKLNLSGVANEANEKHVPDFTKLCQEQKVNSTPISPFIDKELLFNNHLSVNGEAITQKLKSFGKYNKAECTQDDIKAQIQFFIDQGIFPPVL